MSAPAQEYGAAGLAMRSLYLGAGALAGAASFLRGVLGAAPLAEKQRQRRGQWPARRPARREEGPWVWVQAASVGEADLALALARGLRRRRPGLAVVVSSMTDTGRSRVLGEDSIEARYFPVDFAPFVNRIVDRDPPRLFVSIETEIWPETLKVLQARGIPTTVVNARLSERSVLRYRQLRPFLGPVLGGLAKVCARDEEAARRWVAIGASPEAVEVAGNLKFDLALADDDPATALLSEDRDSSPVVLAASTHEGEEAFALEAFAKARASGKGLRLLLVPRHPERAGAVLGLARDRGLRSETWSGLGESPRPRPWPEGVEVLVVDRLGLLRPAYASASAAFVGGSVVVGPGGHNLLEPVVAGCVVATGAFLGNVEDQAALLRESGALHQVADVDGLARFWSQVCADPEPWRLRTLAAKRALKARLGALDRTLAALDSLLDAGARERPR